MLFQHCTQGAGKFFDNLSQEHSWRHIQPRHSEKLARLKNRLGCLAGLRVLEPGCGAGALTQHLREWLSPGGSVLAFDPSPGMFEQAKRRFAGTDNIEVRQAKAEEIKLSQASFDLVICFRVLPHLDDLPQALEVFHNALKTTGRLVVAHFEGRCELNRIHAEAHRMVAKHVFPEPRVLQEHLSQAGFSVQTWVDTAEEIYIDCLTSYPYPGSFLRE